MAKSWINEEKKPCFLTNRHEWFKILVKIFVKALSRYSQLVKFVVFSAQFEYTKVTAVTTN